MAHGGGGHEAAAGFSQRLEDGDPQPYYFFENLLGNYEDSEESWLSVVNDASFGENVKNGMLVPGDEYLKILNEYLLARV